MGPSYITTPTEEQQQFSKFAIPTTISSQSSSSSSSKFSPESPQISSLTISSSSSCSSPSPLSPNNIFNMMNGGCGSSSIYEDTFQSRGVYYPPPLNISGDDDFFNLTNSNNNISTTIPTIITVNNNNLSSSSASNFSTPQNTTYNCLKTSQRNLKKEISSSKYLNDSTNIIRTATGSRSSNCCSSCDRVVLKYIVSVNNRYSKIIQKTCGTKCNQCSQVICEKCFNYRFSSPSSSSSSKLNNQPTTTTTTSTTNPTLRLPSPKSMFKINSTIICSNCISSNLNNNSPSTTTLSLSTSPSSTSPSSPSATSTDKKTIIVY
eukprot:gene8546-10507_t